MKIGSKEEVVYRVKSADLATQLSIGEEDDFPDVFATSRMIALMELAAARLMKSLLREDELSVGVKVNVSHLAATPNNADVRAIAEFVGTEGKLYKFEVELHDGGGKAGGGSHTRAIVKRQRLVDGAIRRVNP